MEIDKTLIKKTIEAWQPYADYPLTEADAREIIIDMRNFALAMIRPNQGVTNETTSNK